ncbi:hypothetical protein [Allofustis seminis]|uniref:hypothetical protein n=1 Tax=Allofustis seminis TaxID=166939 RepID=UPI0003716333|nr:hypothetical protein [Allofustis seminis]
MKKLEKMIPFIAANFFAFYILPLIIKDTGSAMFILLVGIPMINFIAALIYGMKNSFSWLYPLLVMLLFIPTLFIFYNESAWIYIVVYGIISLIGSYLGNLRESLVIDMNKKYLLLISSFIYFLLLILAFFIEVPNFMLVLVGIGVYVHISMEYIKLKGNNNQWGKMALSFIFSAVISGALLIILSAIQTYIIGYDITNALNDKIFKLYCTLSLFVVNTLLAKYRLF